MEHVQQCIGGLEAKSHDGRAKTPLPYREICIPYTHTINSVHWLIVLTLCIRMHVCMDLFIGCLEE